LGVRWFLLDGSDRNDQVPAQALELQLWSLERCRTYLRLVASEFVSQPDAELGSSRPSLGSKNRQPLKS
jgi:hypothetical protein